MHKLIPARSRDAPIPKKLTRHPIATRLEQIYRGLLAGDGAGFPNGRRLADDVVDITLRVAVGGVLAGNKCGVNHTTSCAVFPNNVLGDGVNVNDVDADLASDGTTNLVEPNTHFHTFFPYVDYCPSGRNRRHIDPGEPGCTAGTGPACAVE